MNKKTLIVSICVFIIVGMMALLLILNKGYVGNIPLVKTSESRDENIIMPKLEIKAEKQILSVESKEKVNLIATIDGENIISGIEYTSSDENIVKIINKTLIPVGVGKAIVTGVYEDQLATTEIKVVTPIRKMSFTSTSRSIRIGKDLQMKLKLTPSDADITTLKYTSSNSAIAKVNANGIVTGVSAGKVTITVKDEYTGMEESVELTIRK